MKMNFSITPLQINNIEAFNKSDLHLCAFLHISFSVLRETVSPWENGLITFGPIASSSGSKLQIS